MIETALLMPIMLFIAFNAINFGYFFFVALNLAAAPRTGAQYSILGFSTPGQLTIPPAGPASNITSVSYLTYQDITGVLAGASSARVVVCSKQLGLDGQKRALCCQATSSGGACTSSGSTAGHDPEYDAVNNTSPFIRHQVDIYYQITPIIPSFSIPTPAGQIPLTLVPNTTFHRQVTMRAMD
jgi:hypothetical protein